MTNGRVIKYIFLLGPLLLWLSLGGSCMFKEYQVNEVLKNANGLVWGEGANRQTVHVDRKQAGEISHYRIQVLRSDGKIAHDYKFDISHDIWGSGYVKAANVDDDAELEVVAWSQGQRAYYLNYAQGVVQQVAFSHASPEVKNISMVWDDTQILGTVTFFLFFLLIGYYILFSIGMLIVRFSSSRKD